MTTEHGPQTRGESTVAMIRHLAHEVERALAVAQDELRESAGAEVEKARSFASAVSAPEMESAETALQEAIPEMQHAAAVREEQALALQKLLPDVFKQAEAAAQMLAQRTLAAADRLGQAGGA